MIFVIGFLTFVMVAACLFLILLVLVQLPKKDAGAGMAFGAGTADALFGAGSGNLLTKITGWTAGLLLALALLLGKLQSNAHSNDSAASFAKMVDQKQQQVPIASQAAPAPALQPKPQRVQAENGLLSVPMQAPASNAPAK
jgi:preprotein translocase subunit SecG